MLTKKNDLFLQVDIENKEEAVLLFQRNKESHKEEKRQDERKNKRMKAQAKKRLAFAENWLEDNLKSLWKEVLKTKTGRTLCFYTLAMICQKDVLRTQETGIDEFLVLFQPIKELLENAGYNVQLFSHLGARRIRIH